MNRPESTYQSLVNSSNSSSNTYGDVYKPISDIEENKQYKQSYYTEINKIANCHVINTTQSQHNKMDPKSYENLKQDTIRSIVVSQTWLTGWIRDLYRIEDEIFKAKNKY